MATPVAGPRRPAGEATREIKVVIPADLLVRLHTRKIVSGDSLSLTVTRALEAYFAAFEAHRATPGEPRLRP